jgi:serpin B
MRRRLVVICLVGALGLSACGTTVEAERLDRPVEFAGNAQEAAVPDAWVEASVRIATTLVGLAESENAVVSPLSLQLALAMLREGASGRVADEIDAAIGLAGADSQAVADLRAYLAEYEGDVAGIDKDNPPASPLLHIADGVFIQPGAPVTDRFLERVVAYHLAEVYEADFEGGNAKPVLDAWVNRVTGGLLTETPSEPLPDTLVTLLDAVTFGASWQTPFDPMATGPGPFERADGETVQVPMMRALLGARYAAGEGWQAVELPYTEGFAMRLVLPDAAGALSAEQWLEAHDGLDAAAPTMVSLWMPSWETDTNLDLTDALEALGLGSLPDPRGDLDGVFRDAYVSAVGQAATITVAERGTVAAAVTQIEVGVTSAPLSEIELRLDSPFEYQVIDQAFGLVLFAGRVLDPS